MAAILFMFIIFSCHCAVYMYKIMILQKPLSQFPPNFTLILTVVIDSLFLKVIMLHWLSGPYILLQNLRTAQMIIFSLVAMIGLEKCCITSAYLQWLCHSDEQAVARGPLVFSPHYSIKYIWLLSPCFFKKNNEDIVNASICPCVRLSHYLLLNHWAEFYQTCYITFPYGRGVQEQHSCVRLSSVHLSVTLSPLNHWAEFSQICCITYPW